MHAMLDNGFTGRSTAAVRVITARAIVYCACLVVFVVTLGDAALAHEEASVAGGFPAGFAHPFFGGDHLLAMVAVGIWGGILGRPLLIVLPTVFPIVMALGGLYAMTGGTLPLVEMGIALSVLVLGGLIFGQKPLPIPIAVAIVVSFAIFHGYAHGRELPLAAAPVAYSAGFVLATGLLHLSGVGISWLIEMARPRRLLYRVVGGGIAISGLCFLIQAAVA